MIKCTLFLKSEYIYKMNYRVATINDIKEMHVIRLAVKENVLSNPLAVTENDYVEFLNTKGK